MSLQEYLETITGHNVCLTSFDGQAKLPLILCGYQFSSGEFCSQKYFFARDPECRLTPMQYSKQWKELQEILHTPVILVFDSISSNNRNRLFQAGVPFIVPGCQFFLPPCINFKERVKYQSKPVKVLPYPAQLLVIRELLFQDVSGIMQRELARKTGYSPMSISLAADALTATGLCELVPKKKTRLIQFKLKGSELWENSLPLMRSPVRRTCWSLQFFDQLPLAGNSALAQKSMLSPDSIPTFAVTEQCLKELDNFQQADCMESAKCILEVWHYQPIVDKDQCVDPYSLYVSLKDDGDPRVGKCLDEMMEKVKW